MLNLVIGSTVKISESYSLVTESCYRPQHSCGKVMFLHLSVMLSTGEGVYTPIQTPDLSRHPPADGHCSRRYASYWNAFLFKLCSYVLCFADVTAKIFYPIPLKANKVNMIGHVKMSIQIKTSQTQKAIDSTAFRACIKENRKHPLKNKNI